MNGLAATKLTDGTTRMMPRGRAATALDEDELAGMYFDDEMTLGEIGKIVGLCESRIGRRLKAMFGKRYTEEVLKRKRGPRKGKEIDTSKIHWLYTNIWGSGPYIREENEPEQLYIV